MRNGPVQPEASSSDLEDCDDGIPMQTTDSNKSPSPSPYVSESDEWWLEEINIAIVYTKIWKKGHRDSKAPKIMSSRNQLRADRNQLIRMQN